MSAVRQRWVERLARYPHSGQTVTAFCSAEQVSVPSFYSWKRKLADAHPPAPLVPVQLATPASAALELLLPSGTRLRLPADYNPHHLATLLAALEAHAC
jgi:transposase